jgi:shikimate dehydrogenase
MDTGGKKRLVGVDVADAGQNGLIEQDALDGPPGLQAPQGSQHRGLAQRLGTQARTRLVVAGPQAHAAELAGIDKVQRSPVSKRELYALVPAVNGGNLAKIAGNSFDLIINATSASLSGESLPLPSGIFAAGSLAYDMMYGRGDMPFMVLARQQGAAQCADGLGMLVEQAAEAFFIWRGVRPETTAVLAELRTALSA